MVKRLRNKMLGLYLKGLKTFFPSALSFTLKQKHTKNNGDTTLNGMVSPVFLKTFAHHFLIAL